MVTGRRQSAGASVVGDVSIAGEGLDAALEYLPSRGRIAIDRITLAERSRLRAFLPGLEIVDAGLLVLAGSTPVRKPSWSRCGTGTCVPSTPSKPFVRPTARV